MKEQDESFFLEAADLCDSNEKTKFMRKWIESRFTEAKQQAFKSYSQLIDKFGTPTQKQQIESQKILAFTKWMEAIWTKYLQVALNEMTAKFKIEQPMNLDPEEF